MLGTIFNDLNHSQIVTSAQYSINLATEIVQEIAHGNITEAVRLLRQLAEKSTIFPRQWLWSQVNALEGNRWNLLSDEFINHKFIGKSDYFLMIAPYKICREAGESIQLTAILGRVVRVSISPLERLEAFIHQEFDIIHQKIPTIVPYEQLAACGQVGDESTEAFIVANNWQFSESMKGPSFNNMTEQQRRLVDSGQICIRRIWEPESAEFLLSPLMDVSLGTYYRSLEYQFHEGGHAAGLGLECKVRENLFLDYWIAAVEESRSDGVELEMANNTLSAVEAGKVVAVNLCVRQALDAHRRGGLDRDADVGASLLNFAFLWDSGEVSIKGRRLCLNNLNYQGLLRATKSHREWAMRLTRKELKLDCIRGLYRLYGTIGVHPAVEEIFRGLVVEPCLGVFPSLR
jgi:hypothetical protein